MLDQTRRKSPAVADGRLFFKQADIRTADIERTFDAVLMMFAVLGYQLANADVLSALSTARRHLPSGRIFIFDV
jgi:hypothetical protein